MKLTALYIVVGMPDTSTARECPRCGFDSLLEFPLTSISLNGVGPIGYVPACGRCYDGGEA